LRNGLDNWPPRFVKGTARQLSPIQGGHHARIDRFGCITIAVKDQDEALKWFTEKLGFQKRVDMPGEGMRFVSVAPPKQPDLQVILASWFPDRIGKNPTSILYTDDCRTTYDDLKARGVEFTEPPTERPFGLQAIFNDLYGNSYALLQRSASGKTM
jgi:predicted enzyme related to lactoylglutathione lyase